MSVKPLPTAISGADVRPPSRCRHPASRIVRGLLLTVGVLSLAYASASVYVAIRVVHADPLPVLQTPAAFGLSFREDHLAVRGWFLPGVLPDGRLTAERSLILVHGLHSNRAAPLLLGLSAD